MERKGNGILRLVTLVLILCAFIITVGLIGYSKWNRINQDLKINHENRWVPINQLASLKLLYLKEIVQSSQLYARQRISSDAYVKQTDQALLTIQQTWNTFQKNESNSKDQKSISLIDRLINHSIQTIESRKKDLVNVQSIEEKSALSFILDFEIEQLIIELNDLQSYYFRNLESAYTDSQEEYASSKLQFERSLTVVIAISVILSAIVIRDINKLIQTLQKRTQEAIDSDSRFRNFIQNAGDPILIFDNDLNFMEINHAAEELLGFSKEEVYKKPAKDFIVDYDEMLKNKHIEQIRARKNRSVERKFRRKDGTFIEVEVNATELPYEGYISIIRDISERKETQLALQKSDEKYRYLFKNSPAYIIIWDLENFQIKEVNQAVLDRYGYTEDEWKHMNVFKYRHEKDYDKIRSFAKKMLDGKQSVSKGTWIHLTKQREEIVMEIASHKIIYEGKPAVLSLANDVTDKQKAALELQEKKDQLKLFIDLSPAALAMLDTDMRYLETSRRWISDYGLFGQEIIGKTHYEIFPEIPERWKEIHRRSLAGSIEKSEEDYFIREDGKKEWIKWQIYPWYKATGEIGGIVMMTEVITDRRNAQEMFQYQFENSPDIILIVNRMKRIEKINRTVVGGRPVEELVGSDCIEILSQDVQELALNAFETCIQTGEDTEIEHFLRPEIYVRSRFVPIISEEKVTHVMIFASDITPFWKANLELQQSEYKLRMLTEKISDTIVLLNDAYEIVYVTSVITKITGYEPSQLLYKHVTEFMVEEDIEIGEKAMVEATAHPGTSISFQFRIRDIQGKMLDITGDIVNQLEDPSLKAFIINFRLV